MDISAIQAVPLEVMTTLQVSDTRTNIQKSEVLLLHLYRMNPVAVQKPLSLQPPLITQTAGECKHWH